MIITRPRGLREYVLERERKLPVEQQTVFLLDDLRERDRVRAMDAIRMGDDDSGAGVALSGSGSRTYQVLKAGFRGWKPGTLRYEDGTPVDYVTETGSNRPSDEALSLLLWEDKIELSDQILSAAFPSEDDKGKSEPSSTG